MSPRLFAALLFAPLAFLVASSPAIGRDLGSAGPCSSGNVVSTRSYTLALVLGYQEEMYLPSEVKARHIKTGEIMLGGEMSMLGTPPAGTRIYTVAVHICTRSGAVVTKLKPTIVVSGTNVPAAVMVGVGKPITDYHYGNDIALKPGARVSVKVTVKGQLAIFHATVPKR